MWPSTRTENKSFLNEYRLVGGFFRSISDRFWGSLVFAALLSLFLFLILPGQLRAESTCENCETLVNWTQKNQASSIRLKEILKINEAYLLTLDASDDSQRMKASSNIKIAKKRLEALEQEAQEKRSDPENKRCMTCIEVNQNAKK
jgi:hypothetical protein